MSYRTDKFKETIAKLKKHNDSFKDFIMPPPYRMGIEEVQSLLEYFNSMKG